jgi:thiol-disulfide isomerase/thioredoxin
MDNDATAELPLQPGLQDALAAYQAAVQAGLKPDLESFLARFPELEAHLRPLLSGEKSFNSAETLEPADPPAGAPRAPLTERPTLDSQGLTLSECGPTGQPLADYELLEEIGRGGMGVIFRARQKSLHRIVALKMILSGKLASPDQVRRFRVEAEEAGSLDHPNIVPIYQVGEEQGQHYFSMKLIEGGSLAQCLAEYVWPACENRSSKDGSSASRTSGHLHDRRTKPLRLVAAVARAVHHAHQRGIIHRDLKPANILLDAQGQPHVTDFGLAKHLAGTTCDTQSGAVVGTPSYMAPEQAAAQKQLSTAVDVYSLGAILYELLTGGPPFHSPNPLDTLLQVMGREPPRPRALQPSVPRDLEVICLTCLAKSPARRYAAAAELADDIDRFLAGEPIRARPASTAEKAVKWVRRRPAAAALVAVTALAALGLGLGGWWSRSHLQDANHQLANALALAEERQQEADAERRVAETNAKEADSQRRIAEANAKEADSQRRIAETNAAEARTQAELAAASYRKRLDVVDDLVLRVDGRLANMRGLQSVRLEFLNEALNWSLGLLKEQSDNPAVRRQAGVLYRSVGDLWRDGQHLPEGEDSYRKALELQDRLAVDFPNDAGYATDQAITQAHLAELLRVAHRMPEAEAELRKAIDNQGRLAARLPDAEYSWRAGRYQFELANVLEEAGKPRDAAQAYRAALEQQEKLIAANPKNSQYDSDLARTAGSLAELLEDSDTAAARALLGRVQDAWRRAREIDPHVTSYARQLAESYTDLAAFCRRHGLHAELPVLAEALRHDFPDDNGSTYNAACFLANAAQMAREAQNLPPAERDRLADGYARGAVDLLHKAMQEGWKDRGHMDRDADLIPLRDRADYQQLLAELDRQLPAEGLTAARQLEGLQQEYFSAQSTYQQLTQQARTVAEKRKAQSRQPSFADYGGQALQLARAHPGTRTALDALVWVVETSNPDEGESLDEITAGLRAQALQMLEAAYVEKEDIGEVCRVLAAAASPEGDRVLRAALARHEQKEQRGLAAYALALSLAKQAKEARADLRDDLTRQAEAQFEAVMKEYGTVPNGRSTLGEAAKLKLYESRYLTVGRAAADIEGEDFEGQKFKLSDYRGKVVVLDFWANWCGYCRQMYPQEKAMVKRLKDRPFALVGVNCDEDRAETRRVCDKEGLTWRSWWDGGSTGGRIRDQWQVNAFPTIYVLDHKGIIRFTGVRGPALDAAVEQLLKECEGKTSP